MGTARGFLAITAALLQSGCFGLNAYATPEPLSPGKTEVVVAPEAAVFSRTTATDRHFGDQHTITRTLSVAPPTVLGRAGVTEGMDVGFGVKNGSSLGADAKIALPSGDGLRGAILPSVQASMHGMLFDLPLLIGVRTGERVTWVLSPGIALPWVWDQRSSFGEAPEKALGRVGLGVRVRVIGGFSVHPEVTFAASRDTPYWLTGGLGLSFGPSPP